MLESLIRYVRKELHVIKEAPLAFGAALLICIIATWFVFRVIYGARIDFLEDRVSDYRQREQLGQIASANSIRTVYEQTKILPTDSEIRFDATKGDIIQALPELDKLREGQRFNFQKVDATKNKIVLQAYGKDVILFPAAVELSIQGVSSTFEAHVADRQWVLNP